MTDKERDWLKSLKPQPKQECEVENESIRKIKREIETELSLCDKSSSYDEGRWNELNHLKLFIDSLQEDSVSVKNKEWSEEDEVILNALIKSLQGDTRCFTNKDFIDFLKSIKPRWKPSEEQMEALEVAIRNATTPEYANELECLYKNLLKL